MQDRSQILSVCICHLQTLTCFILWSKLIISASRKWATVSDGHSGGEAFRDETALVLPPTAGVPHILKCAESRRASAPMRNGTNVVCILDLIRGDIWGLNSDHTEPLLAARCLMAGFGCCYVLPVAATSCGQGMSCKNRGEKGPRGRTSRLALKSAEQDFSALTAKTLRVSHRVASAATQYPKPGDAAGTQPAKS